MCKVGKGKRGTGRVVAAKDCAVDTCFTEIRSRTGTEWNLREDLGITNAYTIEARSARSKFGVCNVPM